MGQLEGHVCHEAAHERNGTIAISICASAKTTLFEKTESVKLHKVIIDALVDYVKSHTLACLADLV